MARKSKSNVYNRWVLHTDAPDIHKDNRGKYKAEGGEWESPIDHPEGVREHRHEYGSSLFVTHARTRREALNKIEQVGQRQSKEAEGMEGEVLYRNPKFAFHKENRGFVKPEVIKGDKEG